MENLTFAQLVIITIFSSGLFTGIFTVITRMVWSPESKNDLARLGNEFAHQLLEDARSERKELRLTIAELEELDTKNQAIIDRLQRLADEKDRVINELEERQVTLAKKLQRNERITLQDIFGDKAPKDFLLIHEEPV